MGMTETIVKKILKHGSFCLEFIDDPDVAKRDNKICNRVLYSGSAIGNGKFLWLVGERGLSEDGKETLYILSNHADVRERIEKELIWRFEHAMYVYNALAETVLKDERKDRGEKE